MLYRYLITILLLSTILTSCYEGYEVAISNDSKTDKNIRVIYPAGLKLPMNTTDSANDSLLTYDHTLTANAISSRDYYRYAVKTPLLSLDTINKTYSFTLKPNHQAIIERGWPGHTATYGQIFIIDNSDTIELKKQGKDFKKRGSNWSYSIKDKKE